MPTKDILVVTDADNTLWDTNAAYARAQLALLADVENSLAVRRVGGNRLSFVRRLDEKIASSHPQRWKYPPTLLVNQLTQALLLPAEAKRLKAGTGTSIAPDQTVKIADDFLARVSRSWPSLRVGVKRSLADLKAIGATILVATEEHRERCRSILLHYELSDYITDITSGAKTVQFFQAIMNRFARTDGCSFCVGDQIDRDIAPAKLAGFVTILFPSGFKPTIREHQPIEPDYVVHSYDEVVRAIRRSARRSRPLAKFAS